MRVDKRRVFQQSYTPIRQLHTSTASAGASSGETGVRSGGPHPAGSLAAVAGAASMAGTRLGPVPERSGEHGDTQMTE